MAGTIKTFNELANPTTGLLADNSVKGISAQDVRTIVTSNYQPQMVYHGTIWNNNDGEGSWRVLYYNPDFFQYQNPTAPSNNDNIWQITSTGSGMTDGTYNNVTITPSAPVATNDSDVALAVNAYGTKATVIVSGGVLTSFEITSPGTGWINPPAKIPSNNGMTGVVEVPGSGTKPTLIFNGPIRRAFDESATETQVHRCTTNPTAQGSQAQADFTLINTCVQAYSWRETGGRGIQFLSTSQYPANHFKLTTGTQDQNMHVTLWRVAANV